jgi:hypothetical protein
LNLVIWFLILKIRSLGFTQVLNRFICHSTVKVHGLLFVTCVSFDRPVSIAAPNINVISSSVKSSIGKKKWDKIDGLYFFFKPHLVGKVLLKRCVLSHAFITGGGSIDIGVFGTWAN